MQLQTQSEREPELNNKAEQLMDQAGRCVIKSEDDMRKAADLVKFIKTFIKNAEDDRKEITQPLMAAKREIDGRYKAITEPLKKAEADVKKKMSTFHSEEKLRLEGESSGEESDQLPAEKPVRGDYGATASTRKRWVYEVEDVSALAQARPDLVQDNSKAINNEIRNGAREIPGLKIYQKEDIVVR